MTNQPIARDWKGKYIWANDNNHYYDTDYGLVLNDIIEIKTFMIFLYGDTISTSEIDNYNELQALERSRDIGESI